MSLSYFPRPGATFTKLSMMVLVYYVLVVFLCSSNVCLGNIAPGGSNMNPAMYGSYPQQQQQQQHQQQWSTQQEQYQYHDYPQYQQHQQPQQLQQQQQVDESVTADSIVGSNVVVEETILPLPPGWSEHIDPSSGQTYYYNSNDGTTTWDRPKPITAISGNNETAIPIESSPENDTTTQQHQTLDNPSSSLSNEEFSHMDNRDASAPFENNHQGGDSVNEHHINQEITIEHNTVTSNNENVLTSVRRDENKILEDKQWRESQGWTSPSDRFETGTTDTESTTTTTNPPPNFEHEPPKLPYQEQQGWGLPAAPQQQSSSGWGISQSSESDISKTPTFTEQKAPLTAHHSDQQPKDTTPPPFQSEHNKGSEMSPDSNNNAPVDGELKRDYHQPQHSYPHSDDPKQRQNDPRLLPLSHSQVQQVSPPYQRPAPQQYAPSKEYARPAQSTGGTPHQFAQVHQQRPGYPGQPQYPQHQQSSNSNGGNIHSQQQYPYGTGRPGQIPPQHHRLQQAHPNQQQPYQNQQQYQPPAGQSALQQHQPQAGGQLISQEQQNMVKESLGRTWQNILGLKDKTKEVIETTTNTVAQSAREATQTITEKGTGWWGQATKVLGSVFEAEPPSSEYSLSGIYGNIPPIQTQQQEPPRGLPLNPNYPPQYRRPPQQQFPPQGQGQQHQQPPQQGQYPSSYGPPQPRVDVSYPNEQQGSRQSMPPIQRQLGGNNPQQGYPQQDRPYDTSRQGYQQNFAQQQRRRPPQQQQVKPDDPHTAWSHPGLGSEY